MAEDIGPAERALDTVLDALRSVDHHELDDRYDAESSWRDLMMVVAPLAELHRMADAGALAGPAWDDLRDRVLEPSECIVNHYTSGSPDYVLPYEVTDWRSPGGTNG